MPYVMHSEDAIDKLQVHTRSQAATFFSSWNGDVFTLRFEPVVDRGGQTSCGVDAILFDAEKQRLFTLLAATVTDATTVSFPRVLEACPEQARQALANTILDHFARGSATGQVVVLDGSRISIDIDILMRGRAVPGMCDYMTAVNHIKRYRFANENLLPGSVLDCACGSGYGASMFAANAAVSRYTGVDADVTPLQLATSLNWDQKVEFFPGFLTELGSERRFDNVVSLETMEHVPDPHAFMEHLVARLTPKGRIILSMPAERWAGSHLNPEHLTNWNYDRFEHLVSMRFERYQIVKQQLSFIGTATFERSDIFDRPARSDVDETFVAILEKPRIRRNKRRIVIRRDDALGDTLLATPLVQSVKAQFPDSDVAFVTRHTQVFQGNPFVDLVATPRFEPAEDDQIINLNGAYERSREMHAVEAYFDVAQICPSTFKPTLFPAQVDYRHVAGILLEQWRDSRIAKIVTIHAQASSPDRIWPAEHWKSFLESIAVDESVGVVLVGAGHDFGATELGLQPDARLISFVNSADLMVTAAAIALSDVFVAPDSGLSHVAAAVNTPSVVLFGMAVPATRLSLDGSATSVWSPVECRGCLDDLPPEAAPLCRFGVAHCMEHIDANDVLEPARALLSRASPNAWRRKVKSLGLAVDIPRPTRAAASSRMERLHVLTHLFTKLTRTQH